MIINATHIGEKLDGIGRFSLILAKYFIQDGFEVIINKSATIHFNNDELNKLKIVNNNISPDLGFKGHLKRVAFTNKIKGRVLNLSQLEISFFNKEQIVVVHDIIPLLFPKFHKKQYHFFKYILPWVLKNRVKHIVTVSKHTKELLVNKFGINSSKISVIYNGVDIECKESKKEDYFLFVGRDSPTKNIDSLIEAFRLADTKGVKLILVGVTREIEDKNIKCLGYISDEELKELYSKAKYFIFPTLYEGFGFPAIEAMRCKCGVIVSNVGSLPEICKDGALYVDPNSVEDISKNIEKIIRLDDLNSLVNRAYSISKEYSWDKTYKKYKEVLQL